MTDPVAAFQYRFLIVQRERQQGFEFADPELFPGRADRNRQTENFPKRTLFTDIHGLQLVI